MLEALLPFVLTSLAIELTPGPNMGYLVVLSLDRGRPAGLAAVSGAALGLLALGLAAGFGLGSFISETRWLYEALRWGGVAFLVWLAWDCYQQSRQPLGGAKDGNSLAAYFRRGLISNLINPKATVFYVAVLPNFIGADAPAAPRALVLTTAYVAVATIIHLGIVLLASLLQPLLASDRLRRGAGLVFSALLALIAAWLAISTHRAW